MDANDEQRCNANNGAKKSMSAGYQTTLACVLRLALLMLVAGITPRLGAQNQPFSSTAEYRAMLDELHQQTVLPSRISAGTLLAASSAEVRVKADDRPMAIRLETDALRVEISKDDWGMALTNKQTGLTWRWAGSDSSSGGIHWERDNGEHLPTVQSGKVEHVEHSGNSWQMRVKVEGSTDVAVVRLTFLSPSIVRLSVQAPQTAANDRMQLNFAGEGPFFGLGERFAETKLDGVKTTLHPEDLLGKPGHNWTYIPVPFLFTPRGLGLYLDTAAVSTFDLSQAAEQRFSIQLDHPSVDCYFFAGEPKDIVEDYTALTGRSALPPPWAFGVWICSYQGPRMMLRDARRLREEKIPSSAIWTFDVMEDGGIMGWPLWWTGYYPNPRHLTDQLHGMGFKVLTYVHPYIRSVLDPYNLPSPVFSEGERTGLFVLNSAGKPTGPGFEPYVDGNIDFTDPKNVNWWEKGIRHILIDDNFDGWMGDFGEWVRPTDQFSAGVSGRKMENLNPFFYHKITYEISRRAKPDFVGFVRSGYAGSQGYTRVVWGGDQLPDWTQDHGLPSVVRAGVTAGLSGFGVWGPDIDDNGFSKELWTRWVEFGALTPIMRNHPWDKPEHAVNLWYDSQTIDTFRNYARLHVSLFPYFYTYAEQGAKTGLPIMRHPFLEFPQDAKTYDADQEYMLGEKLLVAPVIEKGATTRSLYLPEGSWVDYWTGKTISGGQQVTVPAPLEHIPILVRSGSILPLISPDTQTLAQDLTEHGGDKGSSSATSSYGTLTSNLTWRVFPASEHIQDKFTLYDGTTAAALQDKSQISVEVTHTPFTRHYEVILPITAKPVSVTVGGKSLDELEKTGDVAHKMGWRMNPDDGMLHVLISGNDFDLHVSR